MIYIQPIDSGLLQYVETVKRAIVWVNCKITAHRSNKSWKVNIPTELTPQASRLVQPMLLSSLRPAVDHGQRCRSVNTYDGLHLWKSSDHQLLISTSQDSVYSNSVERTTECLLLQEERHRGHGNKVVSRSIMTGLLSNFPSYYTQMMPNPVHIENSNLKLQLLKRLVDGYVARDGVGDMLRKFEFSMRNGCEPRRILYVLYA